MQGPAEAEDRARGRGLWPLGLGRTCGLKRRLCFGWSLWFQFCSGLGLCARLGSGSSWRRSPVPSHHQARKCAGPGRVLTATATATVLTASLYNSWRWEDSREKTTTTNGVGGWNKSRRCRVRQWERQHKKERPCMWATTGMWRCGERMSEELCHRIL